VRYSLSVDYNPFLRGSFPVGVITQELHDSERDRILPTEIWYPATDEYQGQDLAEETQDKYSIIGIPGSQEAVRDAKRREGTFPLIIFSHGYGGFNRISSHLCCHLASHGYIVVSPNHVGNTIMDMVKLTNKTEQELMNLLTQVFLDRPKDIFFLIDCVLENNASIPSDVITGENVGVTGHSFGGWTTLMAASQDERISTILPIASAGGAAQDPAEENPFYDALDLNWKHEINTLYIAADKDNQVPIASIYDLFDRTQEPKRMVVLKNADHMHLTAFSEVAHELIRTQPEMVYGDTPFAKQLKESMVPFSELCSARNGEDFLCGLGLAHMDAYVKKKADAVEWVEGDIKAHMAEQGIDVSIPSKSEIIV
jgi:dienelactone hydrolase